MPFLFALGNMNFFTRIGVITKVIHRRGVSHRRGSKVLHLISHQVVFMGNIAQFTHLFDGTSRVRGDKIGNQLLVFTTFAVFRVQR